MKLEEYFEVTGISKGKTVNSTPNQFTRSELFRFFYYWGYINDRMYMSHPQTRDEVKQSIRAEVMGIEDDADVNFKHPSGAPDCLI